MKKCEWRLLFQALSHSVKLCGAVLAWLLHVKDMCVPLCVPLHVKDSGTHSGTHRYDTHLTHLSQDMSLKLCTQTSLPHTQHSVTVREHARAHTEMYKKANERVCEQADEKTVG